MDGHGGRRRFNWKLAIVLVLGVAVLAGMVYELRQWRLVTTARQSLDSGRAAYQAKDWKKAATEIGRYIAVHQDAVPELLMYADAQMHVQPQKENNIRQAVNSYLQVLRYQSDNLEASDRLSELYIGIHMPNDAIPIIERRLKAKDDPDARQLYGMALAMAGKYKEAADEFQKAIDSAPATISAYQRLAELARMRPEEIAASPLEILKTAVSRNPNSAAAHIALGTYLMRSGADENARAKAKGEFDKARKMDLADPNARVNLAARLLESGDYAGARAELDAAWRTNPKLMMLWLTWAALVRANGTPQEAAMVASQGIEQLGQEAYPFLPSAVELYIYAKDTAAAKKTLETIREADATQPDIPYLEGMIAASNGDMREAIRIWQGAAGAERASARVRLALAEAYQNVDDLPAAIRELRMLAGESPNAAGVRLALAKALGRSGLWREALTHAQAACELEPQNVEALAVRLNMKARVAVADKSDEKTWKAIYRELDDLRAQAGDDATVKLLAADIAQIHGDTKTVQEMAASLGANDATKLQGLLLEVETLWRSDKKDEAIARGREIIKAYPASTMAVEQLSDMLARSGDMAGAAAVVDQGIKDTTGDAQRELQKAAAALYVRSGDVAKAKGMAEQIAAANPQDISSRIYLISLTDIKETSKIQELINQIKAIEGEAGFRWKYHQARLWIFSDQWKSHQKEATDLLESNIKADPRDIDSELLLGAAQEKAGRLSLAIDSYRRAYEQAPDAAQVVFYLVGALQKNNNLEEAGQILDESAKRGITEPRLTTLKLGQQLREGQTALAIETVGELLDQQPKNLLLRIFLANLKMREKDLAGAHAILDPLDASDMNVAMAKVDLLMREGRKDDALALSNRMVETAGNAGAYLFRARVLAASGALDDAEADYRKVTSLESNKSASWMALSDFLAARNKPADATKAIEKALDIDGKNPTAVIRAVRLYSLNPDAKVRRSADELLENALKADSDSVDLAVFHAQRLIARGTTESITEARKALDDLGRRRPEMPPVWGLAAQAALAGGDSESALTAISKGLAAEPDDAQRRSLMLLKAEAEKVRWPSLATATLRGLWDKDHKDIAVGLALSSAYMDDGDSRKALSVIEEMKPYAKDRDAASLEFAAADALFAAGDKTQAIEKARAATTPDDGRAMVALVKLLGKADRVDEALATIRDWQKAHPKDIAGIVMGGEALMIAATPPAHPDAASELRAQKLQDAAIFVFKSAVATYPDDVNLKLALATALQARGRNSDAEEMYKLVLDKVPNSPVSLNNLAWLLAEDDKRLKEALELADRGREKFTEFPELIDTRGVIYRKLGRLADADKELREAVRLSRVNSKALTSAKFHLAEVLAAENNRDEAMRYANEALGARASAELPPQDRVKAEELLSLLTQGAAGPKR